jgi:hypothetical protein
MRPKRDAACQDELLQFVPFSTPSVQRFNAHQSVLNMVLVVKMAPNTTLLAKMICCNSL